MDRQAQSGADDGSPGATGGAGEISPDAGVCPQARAGREAPADLAVLLSRYDRPAPRYTSYPAANHFHARVGAADYERALGGLAPGVPLSLYVHIPFCAERCTYCGCHVVPTRDASIGARYLEALIAEGRLVRRFLPGDIRVASLHLGGGTPTFLYPVQIDALLRVLGRVFGLEPAAEIAVELDPRVTTAEHLDVLRARGVRRLSLGIQDTSFEVQAAIGRFQSREVTRSFFALCRARGFDSINVDLVHGLPCQTAERFDRTLEDVIALGPERVAVFGYAHVPWMHAHQRRLHVEDLPTAAERIALSLAAHERLCRAGYVHIGLDHFARPRDELAVARDEGRLGRTFQGYTPHRGLQGIGLGVSAIGELGRGYFQNRKKLADYFASLEAGKLPIERGFLLSPDDELRRFVIQEILCRLRVDGDRVREHWGRSLQDLFGPELGSLRALEADGLVEREGESLVVTSTGRSFLRSIALVFDAYLPATAGPEPVYSRTV